MMSAEALEVEGDTVDEAIAEGLARLGIPRAQASVEIVRDARKSLLGFGGQKAKVRIHVRVGPVGADVSSTPAPQNSAGEEKAREVLRRLLDLMGVTSRVEAAPGTEPGQVWLKVSSDSGGLLIGRHGQTLEALEHLINRMVSREDGGNARFLVDVERYRERRDEELRSTALRLAEHVRTTGRPQSMEPLAARERRVVHVALSRDSSVATRSIGEGTSRRVVIHPAGAADGSSRRS